MAAIKNKHQIFNSNYEYAMFPVSSMLDCYNKTPLHYLVASGRILNYPSINFMMEYIVDYVDDKQARTIREIEMIHFTLSPLLPFIIQKITTKVKNRYLQLCYLPALSTIDLPGFGQSDTKHGFSAAPILRSQLLEEIHEEGEDAIVFNTIMLHCDYDVASDDMFDVALALSSITSEDTFKTATISHLIDHLWQEAKPGMIASTIYFSILMILFSAYIILSQRSAGLEVTVIVLSVGIIFGEVLQARALRSNYLSSIYNSLDLLYSLLMITFMAMRLASAGQGTAQAWVSSLAVVAGYLRWVSHLRLFNSLSI